MIRRPTLLALAAALALLPRPAPAAASPADAFGGRIPPISGRLYSKAGKLELTPTANLSVNDAFFAKYLFGAKGTWHFSELLSAGASFTTGLARETGSTAVCPGNQGCQPANDGQLAQVPGEIRSIAGVELGLSPVYGKLNAFAERVVHFDLSLLVGADWIRYREVLAATDVNAGRSPATSSAFGAHVGLGARIFFARFMALRIEVKDYLYQVPVLGESKLQNQLFTELGVSFFLPASRRAPGASR
jgi:outer membrane beta-barrel protein